MWEVLDKAIESGSKEAMTVLALMYETGKGVPIDREKAVKWYRKAANSGDSVAMFLLGLLCMVGFRRSRTARR